MGQGKAVTVIKARLRRGRPCASVRTAGYRVTSRTLTRTTQAVDGHQ